MGRDKWFELDDKDLSKLIVEDQWNNDEIYLSSLVYREKLVRVMQLLESDESIGENEQKRYQILGKRVTSEDFLDVHKDLASHLVLSSLDELHQQKEIYHKDRENARRAMIEQKVMEICEKYDEKILVCNEIILAIDEMVVICLENVPGLARYRVKNMTTNLTIDTLPSNHLSEITAWTDWVRAHNLLGPSSVVKERKSLIRLIDSLLEDFEILTFDSEDLDLIYDSKLNIEIPADRIELEILLGCNTWYHSPQPRTSPKDIVLAYNLGLVNSILTKAGEELGGISFRKGKATSRTPDDPLIDGDMFHRSGHSSGERYGSQFY